MSSSSTYESLAATIMYQCEITIVTQPEGILNIPLRLHSDAPEIGFLDELEDHSFSCDLD